MENNTVLVGINYFHPFVAAFGMGYAVCDPCSAAVSLTPSR